MSAVSCIRWAWDHPRMCGEHIVAADLVIGCLGSSPHVRGTPSSVGVSRRSRGIIPACAGNTCHARPRYAAGRDHPRMCGEHFGPFLHLRYEWGSSPHVRGTRVRLLYMQHWHGIIPACAGNTMSAVSCIRWAWDHPRMCGEHIVAADLVIGCLGSSPHVRGTPSSVGVSRRSRGIIPACAGNTCHARPRYAAGRDHPRMCGEHFGPFLHLRYEWGSSPHVRGTHVFISLSSLSVGIIPACAGNTNLTRPEG